MRRLLTEGLLRFWRLGGLGIENFGFGVQNNEVRSGLCLYVDAVGGR